MSNFKKIIQITDKIQFNSLLEKEFNNDIILLISEMSKELNRVYRISIKDAEKFLDEISTVFNFIPKEQKNKLLGMQARVAAWKTDYKSSIKYYQKALSIVETKKDWHAAAMIRKGMVDVYLYLSEYEKGLIEGKKALQYFRRKKQTNQVGQVLTNIGNIYHRMDKNRLALNYYNKAKEIFKKNGGIACAIVDFNRANIYANMNELKKAKNLYLQAGSFYKQNKMELAYQQAQYSIAYLLFLESKYSEALNMFEKVYDSFDDLQDKASSAVTQLDLAELNIQLNQYGSTILLTDIVIPVFHKRNMSYEEGKAYYFAGIAKLALGDNPQAKKQLQKAKRIFANEKNNLWLGMIESAESAISINLKRYKNTIVSSKRAISLFKKSKDIRREHDAAIIYIQALFLSKDKKLALKKVNSLHQNDITIEQKRKLHTLVGEYYFSHKEYNKALQEFNFAAQIIEKMISSLHSEEIKFFFAADKFQTYTRIVECLISLGNIEKSYVRHLKAISLVNAKVPTTNVLKGNVPLKIIEEIESLRALLVQGSYFPHKNQRVVASENFLSIEKKLWQLEYKARAYNSYELKEEDSSTVKNIDKPLVHEAVLNYFISGDKVNVFVQTNTKINFIELHTTTHTITDCIRKMQFIFDNAISNTNTSSTQPQNAFLLKLYNYLIKPLKLDKNISSISITPDGVLNQVPFIALVDENNKFLKDKYSISIIIDPLRKDVRKDRGIDLAKKRNSIFSVSHQSIPQVAIESKNIKSTFKNSILFEKEKANCLSFKQELQKSTGFIHIASHASRSSENPLFSKIMFADGALFPFDLYAGGINAQLVTLSGCQTAAPGLNYGNTFSLAKTFHRAGSRFVLASLWKVDDEATMLFMNEFYNQLLNLKNISKAYNATIKNISSIIADPAYWGAFILIGR